MLITVASLSAWMLGFWCWGTPGAQSDLTLPTLNSLSFPSLPHQYMATNDSWNFCMQEHTHVKCFWLHDDLSSKVASCKFFCPYPSCPWPWWVLALEGCSEAVWKVTEVAGRVNPRVQHLLGAPQTSLHRGWASVTLWCPPMGASYSSLIAPCPFARTLVWDFILILLVCVCFPQGKKKKRKRDKQPGETNGK